MITKKLAQAVNSNCAAADPGAPMEFMELSFSQIVIDSGCRSSLVFLPQRFSWGVNPLLDAISTASLLTDHGFDGQDNLIAVANLRLALRATDTR